MPGRKSYIHRENARTHASADALTNSAPLSASRFPLPASPPLNVNSVGSLDNPNGKGTRDDRALREQSGKIRSHFVWSQLVRIRHEGRTRVQDFHQRAEFDRRP